MVQNFKSFEPKGLYVMTLIYSIIQRRNHMTTNTTHKNIILLAVIIIGAIMSGCIDSGATASQIVDDITTISIQKSEIAVEVEKPELAAAQNTPEPIQKSYHVSITAQQKSDSLIITVQGGEDFHILKELRVLVNNETMDVYSPDYQVPRKVGCTIIGDWKVICEGTFEDGTTQELLNTRFNGIPNPKVGTTIAPERYVEPSGTSREEAKRICEENGVVWGCDNPVITPTVTPTPMPTPVITPTVIPTSVITPTPVVTPCPHRTASHIRMEFAGNFYTAIGQPNNLTFYSVSARDGWSDGESLYQIEHIKITIDHHIIASFKPTIINQPKNQHVIIMDNHVVIRLPDGVNNSGEIRITGSFINLGDNYVDGEYTMYTRLLANWDDYGTIHGYPYCDGIYQGI